MTAAKTAGVCLVLAGIALAGPQFRIGTKLTWYDGEESSTWHDSTGAPVVKVSYDKAFVGPTVEAVFGPAWNVLSGRIDLFQVSVMTSGEAMIVGRLLPMLGLELLVEPPVGWRVKPYVWMGARTSGYTEDPIFPIHQYDSQTHLRGGLGGKYRLTRRIDLFAETQLYSRDSWWDGVRVLPDGSFTGRWMESEVVGLVSAEIGARFALGK